MNARKNNQLSDMHSDKYIQNFEESVKEFIEDKNKKSKWYFNVLFWSAFLLGDK